jgi:hypothetical protein
MKEKVLALLRHMAQASTYLYFVLHRLLTSSTSDIKCQFRQMNLPSLNIFE